MQKLFLVFVGAALLWGAAVPAQALTVSPVLFDVEIAPGERQQGGIVVTNDNGRAGMFTLEIHNFTASGEDGAQTYLEEDVLSGLASWITLDRLSVYLEDGESVEFPFLISVPRDAEPGGHYATIFFAEMPDANGRGVGVGGAVGALLLVHVPGEVHEEARIETFTVRSGEWHNRLPVYFDTRLRNLGNTHFRPRGDLVVRNMFGDVVERSSINPKNSAVLPNSIRRVESVWRKTPLGEDRGNFLEEVKREWEHFAIGPYTAMVEVTYGSKAWQLTHANVSFWVIPWRLLVLAGAGVIALILLVMLYHKFLVASVVRRERKRTQKP